MTPTHSLLPNPRRRRSHRDGASDTDRPTSKSRRVVAATSLIIAMVAATIGLVNSAATAAADPDRLGYDFVVTDDGTYIWYTDERAVVKDRTLIAGFVQVDGTAGITSVDLATGRRVSGNLPLKAWRIGDDHANPAILPMNNGRVGVFYAGHDWGGGIRSRISTPGVPKTLDDLGPERVAPTTIDGRNAGVTYNNVFQLSGERNKIYNFFRLSGHNTYFQTSDANGTLQTAAPVPLVVTPGSWMSRQYVKYASNGVDRIDMVMTNGHPWRQNLNMYHAYYKGGNLYKSDGTRIGNVLKDGPFTLEQMTEIYNQDAMGDKYTPWNHELKIGADGNPVLVYSRQLDPYTLDYGYAVYQPSTKKWIHTKVADAGDSLIPTAPIDPYDGSRAGGSQPDYAGGIALNPLNVNEVFISANVNPITGAETPKFEIYRGLLANGSFSWTAITQNSPESNYRPFVPTGAKSADQVVIWMTGKYESFVNAYRGTGANRHFYTGYDTKIVGRYLNRAGAPPSGPSKPPIASFDPGTSQNVVKGTKVTFDAWASIDPDGGELRYEWRSTGMKGVVSTKSLFTREFTNEGRTGVELTVIDDEGQRTKKHINMTVDKAADPVASFVPENPTNVKVGSTLTFDAAASVDPDGGDLRYEWRSTGMKGVVSKKATFTRKFTTAGRIGVQLTVTDDEGKTATKHINVWVSN